jgi:putative transposase
MPNHVHLVAIPQAAAWRITKTIKGFSAREANRILGRVGQPFWQHESFDHWIRDRREMERVLRYVESNPVKAGLVATAAEWPWSSASEGMADPAGRLDKTGVLSHPND